MKCQMARAGAGFQLSVGLFLVWFQLSIGPVKAIDHDLVDPEVRDKRVTLRTIEDNAMCVWSFLLLFGTGSLVLLHVGGWSQGSVTTYWEHSDTTAGVIGNQ